MDSRRNDVGDVEASSRSCNAEVARSRRHPKGRKDMRVISASDLVDDALTSPLSILLDLTRISFLQNTMNF